MSWNCPYATEQNCPINHRIEPRTTLDAAKLTDELITSVLVKDEDRKDQARMKIIAALMGKEEV